MKKQYWKVFLLVLTGYLFIYFGRPYMAIGPETWMKVWSSRLIPLLVVFSFVWAIQGSIKKILPAMGLHSGFLHGLSMAFLCCLPMLAGYAIVSGFEMTDDFSAVVYGILVAPILEEVVYRGFLFGQLYRFGGWGFIPAAIVNGLIFGSLHLYQAADFWGAISVFGVTTLGGLWFAWLYISWNYNLWIPIFMHLFMNAWWMLFEVGQDAAGGWSANIFRIATIVISVVYTIRMKKARGEEPVEKAKLWINPVTQTPNA